MRLSSVAAAAGLLALLVWLPASVQAAPAREQPSGWLELDAGPAGKVHRLAPDGTAEWSVTVLVPGEPATALEFWVEPATVAPGERLLRDHLSVELQACRQPWVDGACASGKEQLLEPTALAEAEGERVQLDAPGAAGSTGTHLLLKAALLGELPPEAAGTRTQIVLGVHGSGDDPGNPGSGSGHLPDTGARLGGFALLGVCAVAAGFALARMRGSRP